MGAGPAGIELDPNKVFFTEGPGRGHRQEAADAH